MSLKEPIIRHAILALGSLHRTFESGDASAQKSLWNETECRFALQHYMCAIRQLIKLEILHGHYADICLISCLIFACFEARIIFLSDPSCLTFHRQ